MTIDELKGNYKVIGSSPTVSSVTVPEKPQKDLLSTSSDIATSIFPGTKTIGESVGSLVAAGGRAVQGDFKGAKSILDTSPSVPQLAGGYVAAGADALGSAVGGPETGVLMKALQSAGTGALMAGGSSVAEGNDIGKVAKDTAVGGVVGGTVSGAGSALEGLLGGVKALPQRLIRSATGQTKAQILAGKDISQHMIENKRIGTTDQLIKSSQAYIDQADKFINESLNSVTDKTVPIKDIVSDITSSINGAGGEVDEAGVRSIIENLAPQVKKTLQKETLSLTDANKLRSQLDKTLGNRAFINAQLPYNKGILMDFTNALREQVKGQAPEGTRAAFNTLSKEMTLRKLLTEKAASVGKNNVIGLGDLISAAAGVTLGGPAGAVAAAGARRAAESTIGKTSAAVAIHHLDKTLSPILEGLAPGTQTAIINAISQALNNGSQEKSQ